MAWQTSVRQIKNGNAGNRQTLRAMSAMAFRGSLDPRVIEAAQNAVRRVPERDDAATFAAVLEDVRQRLRYTEDPLGAELVKEPAYIVGMSDATGASKEPGDCDDASTLCASMLGALGYRTNFVTVAVDPRRPQEWSHVYLTAQRKDGRWVPLDPVVPTFAAGQEVPEARLTAPRAYHEGVTPMRLAGMGRMGAGDPGSIFAGAATTGGVSYPAASADAAGSAWWERLIPLLSTGASSIIAAGHPPTIKIQPPKSPGFFSNPDGTTDWTKVALVGGGAVLGLILVTKMMRGGRR